MASWDDVRRIALALPETTEEAGHGHARTTAWQDEEVVVEAWLDRAPKRVARAWLESQRREGGPGGATA